MYTVVVMIRRKPGMSKDAFLAYYRDRHGPLMAELMRGKGLISYDHFPVDDSFTGGMYFDKNGPAYDAVSVYSFESFEACEACWAIPAVKVDSANCMDMDDMIVLPTSRRRVFPAQEGTSAAHV
ncbi:EthD domain-containing protein [Arthrobacter sp. KNU40]|uniref:EthD domain-containing protein n=1 Tax=Arthrobacter sp. KNU40 TaxID=3447965 RepID=UPI003F6355B5